MVESYKYKIRKGTKKYAYGKNIILRKNELFLECSDDINVQQYGGIKIGDGISHYKDIPYAFYSDTEERGYYTSLKRINDFLYEITYQDYMYDYVKYILGKYYKIRGKCSSVKNGNFHGRNFDWLYDNTVYFVIKTPRTQHHYASVGICGGFTELNKDSIKTILESEIFKILPFTTLDGINEHGVVVNTNIVPRMDTRPTTGTTPLKEVRHDLCAVALPRFILDRFSSAREAVEYVKNYVSIYSMYTDTVKEEIHIMVSDKDDCFVIETFNNKVYVLEDCKQMSNFHLSQSHLDESGRYSYTDSGLTSHAEGIERSNILLDNYDTCNTKNGMIELLKKIKYTIAYNPELETPWLSEFYGDYGGEIGDININTPKEEIIPIIERAKVLYEERDRNDPKTWQTVSSSIYDIENRKLYLYTQENYDKEYEFDLM